VVGAPVVGGGCVDGLVVPLADVVMNTMKDTFYMDILIHIFQPLIRAHFHINVFVFRQYITQHV